MHALLAITWDMGRGIDLGFFTIRFYSLLFALGFILGYFLMKKMFEKAGVAQEKLDSLLTYTVIATVVGARLGHVFFYQWDYYSQHPGEILKVWEGGLASHGAAIAIIIAIIVYCKKVLKKSPLWMLDRLVITVALAGALIRMGNWANSEIYGDIANSNLETVFTNPVRERILMNFDNVFEEVEFTALDKKEITDTLVYPVYDMQLQVLPQVSQERAEDAIKALKTYFNDRLDREDKNVLMSTADMRWDEQKKNSVHVEVLGVPRHPTQLYEALAYFLIFLILYRLYLVEGVIQRQGFIFGMFLILVFGFRFFIEYFKEVQVSSEHGQGLLIGQYLSIPLVAIGLYFVIAAKKQKS